MLRHVAATGIVLFFLLWVHAGQAHAQGDIDKYWSLFRDAALKGESDTVAAMTRFPLWVRGPLDSDPVVYYSRGCFESLLRRLMKHEVFQASGGEVLRTTMREIIEKKLQLRPEELTASDTFSVELLRFQKVNGDWFLTRVYLEDGPYW